LREKVIDTQFLDPLVVEFGYVVPNVMRLQPRAIGRTRMKLTLGDEADRFIVTLNINVRPYQAQRGDGGGISTEECLRRIKKALAKRSDQDVPLNLDLGRPIVITVEEPPAVLMVSYPGVLEFTVATKKSILLQPMAVGRTPMVMLFPVGPDQSEWFFLTLHVNVQKAGSR
jgi:hypothetical protein